VAFRPLAPETERLLLSHPWRRAMFAKLENTIHRAVLLSPGNEIAPEGGAAARRRQARRDVDAPGS